MCNTVVLELRFGAEAEEDEDIMSLTHPVKVGV